MTPKKQLDLWVNGESVHNDERDECCPDFSCCNKEVDTPKETKMAFYKAYHSGDEKLQHEMLMGFLGGLIASEFPKVYVAGQMPEDGDTIN